jgi:hypothetical protein
MIVLSFDVGLIHLGFVKARIDPTAWTLENIERVECVDLSSIPHRRVPLSSCRLYHTRTACDQIQHFLQEYSDELSGVDRVLIERQPPGGLLHVEQLLFTFFRDKAQLISPQSVHKYLGIGHLDYEGRKLETVRRAAPFLSPCNEWQKQNRKHDMADALCFIQYWLSVERERARLKRCSEEAKQRLEEEILLPDGHTGSVSVFFDRFRYTPSVPCVTEKKIKQQK